MHDDHRRRHVDRVLEEDDRVVVCEGDASAAQLAGDTENLFERLRAKRKELADQQGVPPYVIFHDKTLAAMALHRPTTPADLLQISGVGDTKLRRYGEIFLGVIKGQAPGVDSAAAET